MANVYDVGVRFHLTGDLANQLRVVARQMDGIDRDVQRVVRSLERLSLGRLKSEIAAVRRELSSLKGPAVGEAQFGQWSKHLAPSSREMQAMSRAAGTLEGRVERITRSLAQWPDKISSAADKLNRMRVPSQRTPAVPGGYDVPLRPREPGRLREPRSHIGAGFAGVVGVGAGTHTLQSVITQGASTVREDLRAKNAGLTPEQSEQLRSKASEIVQQYPSLSRLSVREQGRLLIPNVGDFDAAMSVLPEYIKGQVALQVTAGPDGGQKDMEAFARFVDIIGRSMSKDDTAKLIDSFVRYRQLDAEAIKSSDFVNAAQSAGAAGKSLSVGFWGEVAPALFSQQKGSRTGTDIASAYTNTAIGRATDSAIIAQAQSGWRTDFQAKIGKNGKLKVVNKGGLVDEALYGANPFEWAKKHVIPDMVAKGLLPEGFERGDYSQNLTDAQRAGGAKYLSDRFSNRRGANIFTMMVQDIEQLDKTMQQQRKARGTADILKDQKKDIFTGAEAAKAQAAGAASALSAPSMDKLAAALDRVTTNLSKTADFLEKNPVAAQSAFAGGTAVVGGLATAGVAALTIAAVSALTLPALTIGSIAAVTIGTFLIPWDEIYRKMGWTPGLAVGGKNDAIKNLDAIGALPGVDGPNALRQKSGTQGLGLTPENVQEAIRRQSELAGRAALDAGKVAGAETAKGFGTGDFLGAGSKAASSLLSGFLSILTKMGEANAASPISFGGDDGGVRALIHKASLVTPSNDNGGEAMGAARALNRGGVGLGGTMPAIPDSVKMTDDERNKLGLIQKYESHGQNTMNYVGRRQGLHPQTAKGYTAQGYFQMLNSNWRRIAPGLGITAPNAMAGSHEEQTRVALHLLRKGGIGNWSNYNPALRGALARGERARLPATPPAAPPPTAGPPPRQQMVQVTHQTVLDGRVLERSVTRHQIAKAHFPGNAGRMDTHGTWSPPSHQGSDAA